MTRRSVPLRPAALLAVVASGAIVLDAACRKPDAVSFNLDIPGSVGGDAAWIEIGAFPQGVCPSSAELAGGIPLAGPSAKVVFTAKNTSPTGFGELPKAKYAFAVVARESDCSVVGQGCSVVDLGSATSVTLTLSPIAKPAGACLPGNTCDEAVCIAQSDAGVGSGCTLSFVGGGSLADPPGMMATGMSAPAAVATDTGFLFAYRAVDSGGTEDSEIVLIPVDLEGAAGGPSIIRLGGACTQNPTNDSAGLAWNASTATGIVAVPCTGPTPGVEVWSLDSQGVTGGLSQTDVIVALSQAHSLAYTRSGLFLADVDSVNTAPRITYVSGTLLGAPSQIFPYGNVAGATGAYITGTNLGTGLLSVGTSLAPPDAGAGDAGEAGADGSADPPPEEDGGTVSDGGTASFISVPPDAALGVGMPPANDFGAVQWLSMGSVDSRILVVTGGAPPANPIVWYAYDIGGVEPVHIDSFAPQIPGDVLFSDVALYADNAFFAAEVVVKDPMPSSNIALFAFRKASTYPEIVLEKDFADEPRIPLGPLSDGLVAVAADATRVAVVWATARSVPDTESLGGYAVFACAPIP